MGLHTEVSRRRALLNGRGEGDLDNRLGMESRKQRGQIDVTEGAGGEQNRGKT